MLDVLAATTFGAMVAADVMILVSLMAVPLKAKIAAAATAAAWLGTMVAIAALGGFRPGLLGPVPTPVVAFTAVVVGSLVAWLAWPAFRDALLSIPLAALVGVNVFRVGGVFFFAAVCGWSALRAIRALSWLG